MSTRMLIDAAHPEETRVAVVRGNRIEEFDFEAANRSAQRGNIYLARVTRVEPSLQAAFVEYGGNRHGFLAFNEIHPDYYQIPHEDRQALLDEEAATDDDDDDAEEGTAEAASGEEEEVEEVGAEDAFDDVDEGRRRQRQPQRRYKIQEVIKRRQILLVQVVKEERGTKGAALTTYLSLAGRYCVLMPNTARGGGVSRRIADSKDRKRLKSILNELDVPSGMGCIIRTNGATRTKAEIKRDYTYLIRLWSNIRELTLNSIAPSSIYEEGDLIKRAIRDMYSNEIDEILVDGAEGYKLAKDMMKMLMPSHAKKVQQYKDDIPLFQRYQVERQLETMYSTSVPLKSGGYLVINPTEALVAIDVNSGKSTRERNVERTAYRTNMEAAEEVARQLRLRDLAGLIVIDFIDMEESRNNRNVERKLKECLKNDRARLQVGRISAFGLLEMSRQRLRPGMLEASSEVCPICGGAGNIRSTESTALQVMREIEEEGVKGRAARIKVAVPTDVAVYILNNKRRDLSEIESRFDVRVEIIADRDLHRPHFSLTREGPQAGDEADEVEKPQRERERERERPQRAKEPEPAEPEERETTVEATEGDGEDQPRSKRRRGRRGGRRRRKQPADGQAGAEAATEETAESDVEAEDSLIDAEVLEDEAMPAVAAEAGSPQPDVDESSFITLSAEPVSAPEAEPDVEIEVEAESEPAAMESADEAPDEIVVEIEIPETVADAPAEELAPAEEIAVSSAEEEPEPAHAEIVMTDAGAEEEEPEPAHAETVMTDAGDEEDSDQPRRRGWWNRDL